MKRKSHKLRPFILLGAAAVVLSVTAFILDSQSIHPLTSSVVSNAYAAGGGHEGGRGGGHDGGHDSDHDSGHDSGHVGDSMGGAKRGGKGESGKDAVRPYRGGKTTIEDLLTEDDEDSKRPTWAGKKGGDSHSDTDSHTDKDHDH